MCLPQAATVSVVRPELRFSGDQRRHAASAPPASIFSLPAVLLSARLRLKSFLALAANLPSYAIPIPVILASVDIPASILVVPAGLRRGWPSTNDTLHIEQSQMMRPKTTSSLQKTYDECYLTCSTAVYFEGKVGCLFRRFPSVLRHHTLSLSHTHHTHSHTLSNLSNSIIRLS